MARKPTTFDFGDGNGPVPAHKHKNGGGWVANTASVEKSVFVGTNARVYGYSRLYDQVALYDHSEVCGANVENEVSLHDRVKIRGDDTILDGKFDLCDDLCVAETPIIVSGLMSDDVVFITHPQRVISCGGYAISLEDWRKGARGRSSHFLWVSDDGFFAKLSRLPSAKMPSRSP